MPGSLRGPFDGVVLDQSTNEPVAGALVLASWAFEDAQGLLTPSASYSTSVLTEVDGTYRLPQLPRAQSRPSALLRRFTLVIYKAGYLGYRSDLRTDDRTPRHDFAQRGNVVRLDRFPQGESHARHLVFLGAGGLLQRAAQAEGKQAALELTEASPAGKDKEPIEDAPPAPEAPPPPLAAKLLEAADVAPLFTQAGLSGEPSLVPLEAPPPPLDTGASGVRYTVAVKDESGTEAPGPAVDLRLWRLESGSEARAVFDQLKARPAAVPPGKPSPTAPTRPTAVTVAPPPGRAAAPPFSGVPAARTVLRDAAGAAFPLSAAPAATAPTASASPAKPLVVDGGLRAYDAATRARELSVLVKQLGLVLQVRCSEALCKDDAAVEGVLKRALARL